MTDEGHPRITRMGHQWDPVEADKAMAALMEQGEHFEEDPPATARRVLSEGLPLAALRLLQLIQGHDDRIAFQASKYLLDRGLGLIQPGGDYALKEKDIFMDLLEKCTSEYGGTPGTGTGT